MHNNLQLHEYQLTQTVFKINAQNDAEKTLGYSILTVRCVHIIQTRKLQLKKLMKLSYVTLLCAAVFLRCVDDNHGRLVSSVFIHVEHLQYTANILSSIHTGSGTSRRGAARRWFHTGCVAICIALHCCDARHRKAPQSTASMWMTLRTFSKIFTTQQAFRSKLPLYQWLFSALTIFHASGSRRVGR